MRHELAAVMFAGVLALTAAATPAPSACDPHPGMNGNYVKPSSLAPGERAYKNAYGAPISQPILTRRVHHKSKSQPQLHTSPLPAS